MDDGGIRITVVGAALVVGAIVLAILAVRYLNNRSDRPQLPDEWTL